MILPAHKEKVQPVRRAAFALLILTMFGSFAITMITSMARNERIPPMTNAFNDTSPIPTGTPSPNSAPTPTPEAPPASNIPPQTPAERVTIVFGEKRALQVTTGIDSFIVVSPEIATAELANRFTLNISGLKTGETILIVNSGLRRSTFIVAITPKPSSSAAAAALASNYPARKTTSSTGTFTTTFAQASGGTSALRQTFAYDRKLSTDRSFQVSGDMFKLLGTGDRDLAIARVENFGLNRISAALETSKKRVDLLDSELKVSPLSLNNYTMRGFHLATKPEAASKSDQPERGLEIFAGLARPSLSFYDSDNGKIAGAMIPVFSSSAFTVRAGAITISPDKHSRSTRGGSLIQFDAIYAPDKHFTAEAEGAYGNGNASWRGKMDVKFDEFGGTAEIFHLARSSPLNSIGAQPGGRDSQTFSMYWRPTQRFNASAGYNHAEISRVSRTALANLERSLVFASVNYSVGMGARVQARYTDQDIETTFPNALSKFRIENRTILIGYNQRYTKNWTSSIEGRLNFSREAGADAGLERGFSLNQQLRYNRHGGSFTAFANYSHKSPSLTSLIVRNPQLLPPELQNAFALDPSEFIRINRERLASLLGGIELPQTRNLDVGVRGQKAVSRFTVSAEARYNTAEILAVNQKNLYLSTSIGIKIDGANSVQVNTWKSIGGRSDSGITVSYTHQLGSSEGGYQLSRLFNFQHGKISGRVFYDLNGNGRPDVGEQGAQGMKVQIDGKRSVVTDSQGRYEFSADEGRHKVVLISGELGVRLLANTPTENIIELGAGQRLNLDFGVRDFGSVSGTVFNDADLSGKLGLGGVKVLLRSVDVGQGGFVLTRTTTASGKYDFSDLRPGSYTVEIDPASVPPNFRVPDVTVFSVSVSALHSSYYDISLAAQRAITGIVYIDKNSDGKYTPGTDEPVEGAYVTINGDAVFSDANGAYLFRNLKAGRVELLARSAQRGESAPMVLDLDAGPVTRRAVNISINR